jgi:hypothetical protein
VSIHSLRRHPEGHVAQKRAAGRYYLDFAGGSACGYGGRDFRNCDTTVKVAAVPLTLTMVAPNAAGRHSTNGGWDYSLARG